MIRRTISKISQSHWHNGFLGAGHRAKAVLDGVNYENSDPFVVFMDDSLDLPGGDPVGGAHPHAGIETLTLVIEGNEKEWKTGSFEIMTAGKGIVHTEEITSQQKIRILQVWLVLPPKERNAQPFFQQILLEHVPAIKTDQYEILVYSGSSNKLTSPLKNLTPLTLVDFKLRKDAIVHQEIPAHYQGLVYVLKGSVSVGDKIINAEEAGWLSKSDAEGNTEIEFAAPESDTRFVLYAAQPHHAPIVSHGPFIAGSMEDITRLYKEYRHGEFPHVKDLPDAQKISFG